MKLINIRSIDVNIIFNTKYSDMYLYTLQSVIGVFFPLYFHNVYKNFEWMYKGVVETCKYR